jgi:hypothetical protein
LNQVYGRSDSKVEIGGFEARHLSDAGRIVGLDIGVEMLAQSRRRCFSRWMTWRMNWSRHG